MSLVGGHGTAIAWGPTIAAEHGFPAALESGMAVATVSLIIASLLGGPIAKFLIERTRPGGPGTGPEERRASFRPEADAAPIDKMGVMRAMLAVNVAVILGYLVHDWLTAAARHQPAALRALPDHGHRAVEHRAVSCSRGCRWPAHTAVARARRRAMRCRSSSPCR